MVPRSQIPLIEWHKLCSDSGSHVFKDNSYLTKNKITEVFSIPRKYEIQKEFLRKFPVISDPNYRKTRDRVLRQSMSQISSL